MSAWPTCSQCGDALERDHWDRWRCMLHGIQKPPSVIVKIAGWVGFLALAAILALALATTIFFGVAWLLTEGTP